MEGMCFTDQIIGELQPFVGGPLCNLGTILCLCTKSKNNNIETVYWENVNRSVVMEKKAHSVFCKGSISSDKRMNKNIFYSQNESKTTGRYLICGKEKTFRAMVSSDPTVCLLPT